MRGVAAINREGSLYPAVSLDRMLAKGVDAKYWHVNRMLRRPLLRPLNEQLRRGIRMTVQEARP